MTDFGFSPAASSGIVNLYLLSELTKSLIDDLEIPFSFSSMPSVLAQPISGVASAMSRFGAVAQGVVNQISGAANYIKEEISGYCRLG